MKSRVVLNRQTSTTYRHLLALSTLVAMLTACEPSAKDKTDASGADTSGMVSDTSTQVLDRQRQADSLAAALASQTAYATKLRNLSATINRACPVSFTPVIYLDSTRVLDTRKVQFNMRIRNYVAGSSEIEPKKDETRKSLMASITADKQPVVADLRRNGVEIVFRYRDKTGQPLFDIPLGASGTE